jgi:serine/threonine protein kinase
MAVASQLARYREIATLGVGGMATVILAEDTVLGRRVALKRLRSPVGDPRGLLRLRREALVGASLSHRNLVSIYDVIDGQDGDAVIVMEYVDGETLRETLSRDGRLAPHEALRVLGGVAAGLDAIHAQGIVHRDVKPANVLLGADGSVKLADLGIASVSDHTRITTAGTVLGSFRYMAPEQLKDGPTTRAIDIYALAAMAFEALSGRQARREPNPLAVAHAIATQPAPDVRDAWPAAPAGAAELLVRGMCRDPAGRPASAGELVARLRAALEPEDTARVRTAVPASRAQQTVRPATNSSPAAEARKTFRASRRAVWMRVLAPLALVLAAGGVIVALLSSQGSSSTAGPPPSSTHARSTRTHTGSGGGSASASSRGTDATSTSAGGTPPAAPSTSAPQTAAGSATAAPPSAPSGSAFLAGSPVSAVESFYELAATHRYSQAWALADPTFRAQLGGYESFQAGQAADRSITFDTARITRQSASAATVYVQTTSVRTSGTQHCGGTVQVLYGGGAAGWLVHTIGINCT